MIYEHIFPEKGTPLLFGSDPETSFTLFPFRTDATYGHFACVKESPETIDNRQCASDLISLSRASPVLRSIPFGGNGDLFSARGLTA
jgi:hypothetical protein